MSGTQVLLTEYTNGGSERAFREIVSSYVNFVFSTALRIVGGDRALAEDVTQAVFTDLARKAAGLPKDVQLGGWLHRHTCFVARKTLRRERRRIAREKHAVELHSIEDYTEGNLAQLALTLDEAINDLGAEDRNAIVLRFFEERDFRSIGEVLGSSEDAARMRVSRAVDKMGALLKRRGFVLSAAGISFVLSGKLATAAPAGLATRIVYVELARAPKAAGIFGVLREACFTRLNVSIVSAAVILGLLVLLFSARRTGAKALPDPDGKAFTPAQFADLAVEESEEQNASPTEVTPIKSEVTPALNAPQPAPVAMSAPSAIAKPAVANVPRMPAPTATAPAPVAMAPTDNGSGGGELTGNGRPLPKGVPGGRPGGKMSPRVLPAPQTPTILSNGPTTEVVIESPNANADPDFRLGPSSANRESMQQPVRMGQPEPVRMGQPQQVRAGSASGRSGDSRKRGGQP